MMISNTTKSFYFTLFLVLDLLQKHSTGDFRISKANLVIRLREQVHVLLMEFFSLIQPLVCCSRVKSFMESFPGERNWFGMVVSSIKNSQK